MRREGVRQAERRSEARAVEAGAQDEEGDPGPGAGEGPHALVGSRVGEVRLELEHVAREVVDRRVEGAAECVGGPLIRAGSPSDAEIDAPRVERRQRAELLGDHQRRVVRQHDAAGADPDGPGACGEVADHDRRGRAGDARHVVVFRHPVAAVAERLGVAGEVERVGERRGGVPVRSDRREVEDGQRRHGVSAAPAAPPTSRWP